MSGCAFRGRLSMSGRAFRGRLVACLVFAACSAPEPKSAEPPRSGLGLHHAHMEAPLAIEAKFDRGVANVQLIFAEAGSGVSVSTRGVRGLVVPQEVVAVDREIASGQGLSFAVAFERAVTPSLLVVEVRGMFGGREQVKIRTFEVSGSKPAPPVHDATRRIRGERITVVPAAD
jgi:hypothetical protein